MATATWVGRSGQQYSYVIYERASTTWNDVPGNYIFARLGSDNRWYAAYIGQTESFLDRIPDHERWPCALRHGATHVHARVNASEAARLAEESDLIQSNRPPCNQRGLL